MKDVLYFAPAEMKEALRLLTEYGSKATVLAGGTDLVAKINTYKLKPEVLLHIGRMGLDYLREQNGKLVIGAMTRTARLAKEILVAEKAAALSEAARQTGSMATRNAATIGGNLANASPAADLATPLLIMDAQLLLASATGKRVVDMKDFFLGPGKTILKPDELIAEVDIPPVRGRTIFLKLGRRRAMTLSVVNVAVRLDMNGRRCNEARIALGAMAPIPMRSIKAETMLKDEVVDEKLIHQCAVQAILETQPIDDQRATAWYRKTAGTALVARALTEAARIGHQ